MSTPEISGSMGGALRHPLLIFPSPIIQLAPLRPTEVKGLAQSPTVGRKQSWDSNSRAGPTANTHHEGTKVVMKNRAGRRLEYSRDQDWTAQFCPGQCLTLPVLGFLSTSHPPRFLRHFPYSSTRLSATPIIFHWFLMWRSVFRVYQGGLSG